MTRHRAPLTRAQRAAVCGVTVCIQVTALTTTQRQRPGEERPGPVSLATMAAPHPALAALILGLATTGVQAIGADILTELISFPLRSNPFFAKVAKISNI